MERKKLFRQPNILVCSHLYNTFKKYDLEIQNTIGRMYILFVYINTKYNLEVQIALEKFICLLPTQILENFKVISLYRVFVYR